MIENRSASKGIYITRAAWKRTNSQIYQKPRWIKSQWICYSSFDVMLHSDGKANGPVSITGRQRFRCPLIISILLWFGKKSYRIKRLTKLFSLIEFKNLKKTFTEKLRELLWVIICFRIFAKKHGRKESLIFFAWIYLKQKQSYILYL